MGLSFILEFRWCLSSRGIKAHPADAFLSMIIFHCVVFIHSNNQKRFMLWKNILKDHNTGYADMSHWEVQTEESRGNTSFLFFCVCFSFCFLYNRFIRTQSSVQTGHINFRKNTQGVKRNDALKGKKSIPKYYSIDNDLKLNFLVSVCYCEDLLLFCLLWRSKLNILFFALLLREKKMPEDVISDFYNFLTFYKLTQ